MSQHWPYLVLSPKLCDVIYECPLNNYKNHFIWAASLVTFFIGWTWTRTRSWRKKLMSLPWMKKVLLLWWVFLRKEPLKTRHVQHLLTMILKCKDRRVTLLLTTFKFINLFKAHSTPRGLKFWELWSYRRNSEEFWIQTFNSALQKML